MEIFPAIDLKGGRVVRLFQGDYDQVTQYDLAPEEAAGRFAAAGAKNLHVVDLDGAKDGALSNFDTVASILRSADLFVEIGGGIRDEARIARYLEAGAGRVILGTAAVNNFPFLTEMVQRYGDKIAVGVDARDGFVAVDGWLTVTALEGFDFCRRVRDIGVKTVIYTDIARDGAMQGANLAAYKKLTALEGLDIVASGGVSSLDEIAALRDMGLYGAILGKALYTGVLDLRAVLEAAVC